MLFATLLLAGCGGDDDFELYADTPVEVLYNRALDDLVAGGVADLREYFTYFAREAVIALNRCQASPYRLRLWRRGNRVLFSTLEDDR